MCQGHTERTLYLGCSNVGKLCLPSTLSLGICVEHKYRSSFHSRNGFILYTLRRWIILTSLEATVPKGNSICPACPYVETLASFANRTELCPWSHCMVDTICHRSNCLGSFFGALSFGRSFRIRTLICDSDRIVGRFHLPSQIIRWFWATSSSTHNPSSLDCMPWKFSLSDHSHNHIHLLKPTIYIEHNWVSSRFSGRLAHCRMPDTRPCRISQSYWPHYRCRSPLQPSWFLSFLSCRIDQDLWWTTGCCGYSSYSGGKCQSSWMVLWPSDWQYSISTKLEHTLVEAICNFSRYSC